MNSGIDLSDIVMVVSFIGTLAVLLISTRFVTKTEYKEDKEAEQKFQETTIAHLNELDKNVALSEQPVAEMNNTLKRIEGSLNRFIEEHQALERRVYVMERDRSEGRQ